MGNDLSILNKCDDYKSFFYSEKRVRILRWHTSKTTKEAIQKIEGGRYPKGYMPREDQVLGNPGDSMGLVFFESCTSDGWDFAVVDTLDMNRDDVVNLCKKEHGQMRDVPRGTRPGPAGGVYVPTQDREFDSLHCSSATKGEREFFVNGKGKNCWVSYFNEKTGRITVSKWVYACPIMTRQSKLEKKLEMLNCGSLREKNIKEMKSRLYAMILCTRVGLLDRDAWYTFRAAMRRVRRSESTWREAGCRSTWEALLLEWASGTGEMKNYEALGAHVDKNKAHPLESYTVFGRVGNSSKRTTEETIRNMRPGLLALPHQGIYLKTQCGVDVWHLQLRHTVHIADDSRDQDNWSWVHGP